MPMTAKNTKYAFRQHLANIGFAMGQSPDQVMQQLRRHMGEQRFQQYQQVANQARGGGDEPQNRIYDFMRDLKEANLLRSLSPDVTQDVGYYLYEKAAPHLAVGKRVIELACWTGGLASFIAENHPDCTVVGVDRAKQVVDVDRAHYSLPNLKFVVWDYRKHKPDKIDPADVLLCSLGVNNDCPLGAYATLDPQAVRQCSGYHREHEEALAYFGNWRMAAKDGAMLFTVLRVFTFPRFMAFLDAAQQTGWTAMVKDFTFVQVPANREAIPSLLFEAAASGPISEDEALSHWMRITGGKHEIAKLAGPVALGVYRSLGDKQVLANREYRNEQGFATKEELGICGAFGYIYGQDARPDHRLILMDVAEAESQRQTFTQLPQRQMAVTGANGGIGANNVIMCLGGMPLNLA